MAIVIDEIRQWGRENGWEVGDGGRLPSGLRAAYDNRDSTTAEYPVITDDHSAESDIYPGLPLVDTAGIEEIPPHIKGDTLKEKAGSLLSRVKKAAPPPVAKPRGRRPLKARISVEKLISGAWQLMAQAVQPINLPVARMLDYQAPVAGVVLEDTVQGTVIDRILQPIARAEAGGEKVFALLGPPLLVFAISNNTSLYPKLRPALRMALARWVDIAGPAMETLQKRDAEFKERYGTQIDDMIDAIFAPSPDYVDPS
jgi:hypothetical protein